MKRNILVIDANPKSSSFCDALAKAYVAASHSEVQYLSLSTMQFNPDLSNGYDSGQPLEPDLVEFQAKLQWAEHIVLFIPVWWGGLPAKFKGLIDRTFLPGFAFKYQPNKTIPDKLLKGRTAEVVLTLDTPAWYYRFVQGAPVTKQLKHTILGFSGIKVISTAYFGPIISSTPELRVEWLNQAAKLARK
ncbi:NAD(P)H-dependent oxidoreductase [Pseudoalteromonas porphyrae]|uniref:NAD(P)H dehydrogenase n=1 Tax=Pseudoalteromonas porphyrae TaxID=187330 RepID=A0A0N1MUG3_9GAMM|nr:NAD(P)H-dependent oxidoreductase [Pseudoalteromonas porphyrae]KPH65587.1 NAD(P)H dehydrogenase [Pseudoalteromonas porphyrae]